MFKKLLKAHRDRNKAAIQAQIIVYSLRFNKCPISIKKQLINMLIDNGITIEGLPNKQLWLQPALVGNLTPLPNIMGSFDQEDLRDLQALSRSMGAENTGNKLNTLITTGFSLMALITTGIKFKKELFPEKPKTGSYCAQQVTRAMQQLIEDIGKDKNDNKDTKDTIESIENAVKKKYNLGNIDLNVMKANHECMMKIKSFADGNSNKQYSCKEINDLIKHAVAERDLAKSNVQILAQDNEKFIRMGLSVEQERDETKAKLEAAEKKLEKLAANERKLKLANERVEKQQGDLATVREELAKKQGELKAANEQLGKLKANEGELKKNKDELATVRKELADKQGKLKAASAENERLKAAKGKQAEAEAKLKADNERELNKNKDELADAKSKLANQQDELKVAKSELAAAKSELKVNEGKLNKNKDKLATVRKELANKQGELKVANAENKRLKAIEGELEAAQGQLEAAQGQLAETQRKLAATQGQLVANEERVESLLEHGQVVLNERIEAQRKLAATQGQLEAANELVNSLNIKGRGVARELNEALRELKTAQGQLEAVQAQLKGKERELKAAQVELKTAQGQLEAALRKLSEKIISNSSLKDTIGVLQGDVKDWEQKYSQLQNEHQQKIRKANIPQLQLENQNLKAENIRLKGSDERYQRTQNTLNKVRIQLTTQKANNDLIQGQLTNVKNQFQMTESNLKATRGEVEKLQKNNDKGNKAYNELKNKLNEAQEIIDNYEYQDKELGKLLFNDSKTNKKTSEIVDAVRKRIDDYDGLVSKLPDSKQLSDHNAVVTKVEEVVARYTKVSSIIDSLNDDQKNMENWKYSKGLFKKPKVFHLGILAQKWGQMKLPHHKSISKDASDLSNIMKYMHDFKKSTDYEDELKKAQNVYGEEDTSNYFTATQAIRAGYKALSLFGSKLTFASDHKKHYYLNIVYAYYKAIDKPEPNVDGPFYTSDCLLVDTFIATLDESKLKAQLIKCIRKSIFGGTKVSPPKNRNRDLNIEDMDLGEYLRLFKPQKKMKYEDKTMEVTPEDKTVEVTPGEKEKTIKISPKEEDETERRRFYKMRKIEKEEKQQPRIPWHENVNIPMPKTPS